MSACALLAASSAAVAQQCSISEAKKEQIQQLLCGQFAPETSYRMSGANCFAESTQRRANDTAMQVFIFGMCGQRELADRLTNETRRTLDFLKIISVCADNPVDVHAVFESSLKRVGESVAGQTCSPERRKLTSERAGEFTRMLDALSQRDLEAQLAAIGLRRDAQGNLVEAASPQ